MEIIDCLLGKNRFQYGHSIKEFFLTLNYYSPRAYSFVRQKFNDTLPHQSTIRKWYANSYADGEPGICKESLNCLSHIVNDMKSNGCEFYCALAFDEVSIRHHVQYIDRKHFFFDSLLTGMMEVNNYL